MIRYSLRCTKEHAFDSWFQSAGAYDALHKAGHIAQLLEQADFDPEAAHVVFSSWPQFDLVDWEACVRHAMDFARFDAMLASGDERARFYAAIVRKHTRDLGCKLVFEPGRLIVGNAGVLVAGVIYLVINFVVTRLVQYAEYRLTPHLRPAPGAPAPQTSGASA